jgi:hypothetical protein
MMKAYEELDWEVMGERLADIAFILHEYERKVLGDKKLKEEDDA